MAGKIEKDGIRDVPLCIKCEHMRVNPMKNMYCTLPTPEYANNYYCRGTGSIPHVGGPPNFVHGGFKT